MTGAGNFAPQYVDLLHALLNDRRVIIEENKRTGTKVRIWPGMISLNIDLQDRILPTCGVRKTHPHVAAAENAWCLLGHNHIEWLMKHASVWNEFAEMRPEDGYEGIPRGLPEAYGHRWRHAFGRDQLMDSLAALTKDPSNRRIWISSWHPGNDGLARQGQKTVPCPVGFTLQVMGGKLFSTYVLRSSDTMLGLPHDVMRHALLMDCVSQTLNVDLGVMSVAIANSHLYEPHWEMAAAAVDQDIQVIPALVMPGMMVRQIIAMPDEYVRRVKERAARHDWPKYNPKPELVK